MLYCECTFPWSCKLLWQFHNVILTNSKCWVFDASESFLQITFLDCIQDPVIHGSLLGMQSGGGLAEYALAHISTTAKRPLGVTAIEGACLGDAAFSALQSVRDWAAVPLNGRKLKVPPNILITDASGAVGTFAVQVSLSLSLSLNMGCRINSGTQHKIIFK